jgi:hypothetical protein
MTIYILLPLLVCIIGVLIYALASNGKAQELGRIAYFAGLLVTLFEVANHVIKF